MLFLLFGLLLSHNVSAEDMTQELLSPEAVLEKLLSDELSPEEATDIAHEGTALLSPEKLFSFGLGQLRRSFSSGLSLLAPLIAVILLSNVVGIFSEQMGQSAALFDFAFLLGTVALVLEAVQTVFGTVEEYLQRYLAAMTAANGSLCVLLAAGGEATAAAVSGSSVTFSVALTQLMSIGVVLPCVRTVLALGVLSALSSSVDLSGIIGFIRSFCTWGLGVLFAVFGGVQASALRTASGADTALVRGIRFSAARLIPVAGNMLSECFRTVLAGVGLIKSAVGGVGIAYIVYLLVPTVCAVLALKLAVLCGLFCAKLMGTRPITAFLESVGTALNLLLAICFFASVGGIVTFASLLQGATTV